MPKHPEAKLQLTLEYEEARALLAALSLSSQMIMNEEALRVVVEKVQGAKSALAYTAGFENREQYAKAVADVNGKEAKEAEQTFGAAWSGNVKLAVKVAEWLASVDGHDVFEKLKKRG